MIPLDPRGLLLGPVSACCPTATRPRPGTGACCCRGISFLLLEMLPINFGYVWFAAILFLFAVGHGAVLLAQPGVRHESLPADQRGVGAGMLTHSRTRPTCSPWAVLHHLTSGWPASCLRTCSRADRRGRLRRAHVARSRRSAALFSAFLGYNPVKSCSADRGAAEADAPPGGVHHRPSFFPGSSRARSAAACTWPSPSPPSPPRSRSWPRPARQGATCTPTRPVSTSWPTGPLRPAAGRPAPVATEARAGRRHAGRVGNRCGRGVPRRRLIGTPESD